MSRKYCELCGVKHNNGSEGMCDHHLEVRRNRQRADAAQWDSAFDEFMAQTDEDRWRQVFDALGLGRRF